MLNKKKVHFQLKFRVKSLCMLKPPNVTGQSMRRVKNTVWTTVWHSVWIQFLQLSEVIGERKGRSVVLVG